VVLAVQAFLCYRYYFGQSIQVVLMKSKLGFKCGLACNQFVVSDEMSCDLIGLNPAWSCVS
jgi:hypothetical protein